jgi:hypothetical protein
MVRSAGLGAFAFSWDEYQNTKSWDLFWNAVYAGRSRNQILALKDAYWSQRQWSTQIVGSLQWRSGPNGSGWVQEFNGPGGRRLLMLENGKNEAFWVLGSNYQEYMNVGGPNGSLGFPRSNENVFTKDGKRAVWQAFSAYNGTARIHNLTGSPSVATWGKIGELHTHLGGAYHWLGMPTRREYMDGDTIFSDFQGGRIAYNHKDGRTEALRPGQQPSWRPNNSFNNSGSSAPFTTKEYFQRLYGHAEGHWSRGLIPGHYGIDSTDTKWPYEIRALVGGHVIDVKKNGIQLSNVSQYHDWGYNPITRTWERASEHNNKVVIWNPDLNRRFTYLHFSEVRVNVGDKINPGQIIGIEGSTGWSTGRHMHLEVSPGKSGGSIEEPLVVLGNARGQGILDKNYQ